MTTIATDGQSIAGDSLCHDHMDTVTHRDLCKVYRLSDGRMVGAAGNSFDATAWRAWLERGKKGDCPIESDRFCGIIVNTDRSALWVDFKGREYPTPTPFAAGSGQDYAFGAFHMGATPRQAVEAACARDLYSGGSITVLSLEAANG